LEVNDIIRPNEQQISIGGDNEEGIRKEWALTDYVDPEEEEGSEEKASSKTTAKPVETVKVIKKIRYFISEQQANDFIGSCW
jgi:hypothetical protein